jgi:hypothetical protein
MLSPTSMAPAPTRHAFDYAVVRVVPRVERDEFINAGVILHCPTLEFLDARVDLDRRRLAALAPGLQDDEVALIERYLDCVPLICAGGEPAGPLGRLAMSARFHWLVAPRSHVVQTSPVHAGLCTDPAAELDHLIETVVRLRPRNGRHDHSPLTGTTGSPQSDSVGNEEPNEHRT